MPAWSTDIANELVKMAASQGGLLDQIQLQELVYIAHGWCLAMTGQPLTGDRPEALSHGPEYRRLAAALAKSGVGPVTGGVGGGASVRYTSKTDQTLLAGSLLLPTELDILRRTYADYGALSRPQLASVTRAEGTPWSRVFAGGAGEGRDIPHEMIRAQFADIAAKLDP